MPVARIAIAAAAMCVMAPMLAGAQVSVTTYHNDNLRTGWNPGETSLTQSNLRTFGPVQRVMLDDQVDAEPLIVGNETINGTRRNVVYVATESNSIYAIDAESGQVLLKTNLGSPVPSYDLPGDCNNNGPDVGIDSTPVIDASTGALYVIAYVLRGGAQTYALHALSLTTLADILTPQTISASGLLNNGKEYRFNAAVNRQRAALLLANGTIYAGFGSFCDTAANLSRGWVLGWQANTLAPLASNELTNTRSKSPDRIFLTSVWMSGYGPAADAGGSVYFVTGNSDYSGTTYNKKTNIAESAVEMNADLSTVQSLFTPGNHRALDRSDDEFGAGGLMLLPAQPGLYSHLAAAAGKDGSLYLLDSDELERKFGAYQIGRCWCGPSYYRGGDGVGRIVTSGGTTVEVFAVHTSSKKKPVLALQSQFAGIAGGQNPGFFTSVSSNGTTRGTAVVWAVGRPTNPDPATVDLYAIDPDNGHALFSDVAGQWRNTTGDSNIVPMVANGRVYVASDKMLTIFALGGITKTVALPAIEPGDVRVPLARGEHEIYGTVLAMEREFVTIRTRKGNRVRIDTSGARRASRFAQPSLGHALFARGRYAGGDALFLADTVQHAVNHPVMWPADR